MLIHTQTEIIDEIVFAIENKQFEDDEIKHQLNQIENVLQDMKISIHDVKNIEQKKIYLQKMKNYNDKLSIYRKRLLISRPVIHQSTIANQNRSISILKDSYRQLIETEDVATSTIQDLERQKELIGKVQGNLDKINVDMNYSNRLVNSMLKWWK